MSGLHLRNCLYGKENKEKHIGCPLDLPLAFQASVLLPGAFGLVLVLGKISCPTVMSVCGQYQQQRAWPDAAAVVAGQAGLQAAGLGPLPLLSLLWPVLLVGGQGGAWAGKLLLDHSSVSGFDA